MMRVLSRFTERGDERGVTMIELLVATIIAGLVTAVIAATLIMGVRLGPTVHDRSTYSTDASFLVNLISTDVANATSAVRELAPPDSQACEVLPAGYDLYAFKRGTTTTAYTLDITPTDSPTATSLRVTVSRQVDNGDVDVLLEGYCAPGDPVVEVSYVDPVYTLDLDLRVTPNGDMREISLSAAHRVRPAGTFALQGWVSDQYGPVDPWEVTIWDATQTNQIATLTTDAAGKVSTTLDPGVYVVCQTMQGRWAPSFPSLADFGAWPCPGGVGYRVSPAFSGISFINEKLPPLTTTTTAAPTTTTTLAAAPTTTTTLPPVQPYCTLPQIPAKLAPYTGHRGPDVVVRTDLGQSIQTAVDAAAQVDGSGTALGDVNGDEYIIVAIARDPSGSPSGSVTQSVIISATYPRPFVLTACSATLRDPIPLDAIPTIRIAASATSPVMTVLGRPTTIAVIGLNASRSSGSAAIEVLGNRRYIANSEVTLSGDGYRILGDDNTLHNGEAFDNSDDGIVVIGQGNHLEDVDAYRNTGDGFDVSGGMTAGTANRFEHLVSNNSASGSGNENVGAEYRVLNYIRNVDDPIKADNVNVPYAKCTTFPADGITKDFPVVEVCE